MSLADREVRERVARIDSLLERVESIADPSSRDAALATVQALLDLYGEGLGRVVSHIAENCDDGTSLQLAQAFGRDELLSHLLLLHGLHPDEVHQRVEQALDGVRPYLASHGGNVELVEIDGGVARVQLAGSCHGCASSEATLHNMVEEAVRAAAPELSGIESAGGAAPASDTPALVPLRSAHRSSTERRPQPAAVLAT